MSGERAYPLLARGLVDEKRELAQALDVLDASAVVTAARQWFGRDGRTSKKDAVAQVRAALADEEMIGGFVARLDPGSRLVLAIIVRYGGCISGPLLEAELCARKVIVRAPNDDGTTWRGHGHPDPARRLREALLVRGGARWYPSYGASTLPEAHVSSNVLSRVEPAEPAPFRPPPEARVAPGAIEDRAHRSFDAATGALIELAAALSALGSVDVNAGGVLSANARKKLAKALRWDDDRAGLHPPDPIGLAWSLLLGAEVVLIAGRPAATFVGGGRASLDRERFDAIVSSPPARAASLWTTAWLRASHYVDGFGAISERERNDLGYDGQDRFSTARELLAWMLGRLAHARAEDPAPESYLDLEPFLLELERVCGGALHFFPRFAQVFRPKFLELDEARDLKGNARLRAIWLDTAGRFVANAVMCTLVHLGLIERGRVAERWCFRLTDLGAAVFGAPEVMLPESALPVDTRRALVVQPNLELQVYLDDADGRTLATVHRFARRVSAGGDRVQTFRLDGDTIYGALEGGMTPGDILDFLVAHAKRDVPASVKVALDDWSRARDSMRLFRRVSLVVRGDDVTRASVDRAVTERAIPEKGDLDAEGHITFPPSAELVARLRVARFADPTASGFVVNAASVSRGAALGLKPGAMVDALTRAVTRVPRIVALAIHQWSGGKPRLFADDRILVRADAETEVAIMATESLRDLVSETVHGAGLLVERRHEAMFRERLARYGLVIGTRSSSEVIAPDAAEDAPASLEITPLRRRARRARSKAT